MSGTIQGSIPALISAPPSAAQSYLIAAQGFFEGAEALAKHSPQFLLPCAFLSSQALECTLKSFLAHKGKTEKDLRSIGHDLETLWVNAANHGLQIESTPKPWCELLNSAHNKPYFFRYPMGLNGISYPAIEPMISELNSIIILVKEKINLRNPA